MVHGSRVALTPIRGLVAFCATVAVFSVLFLLTYIIARRINPDPIVYYSGNRIVLTCAVLYGAFGAIAAWRGWAFRFPTLRQMYLPSVIAFVLTGYSFVITLPSLLDRSISIYVISTVTQAGAGGIPLTDIQDIFLRGYIGGTTTVEKRLHEQIVSHHIDLRDGRYYITPKGAFVHRTNVFLGKLLNIPDKYIIALNGRADGSIAP